MPLPELIHFYETLSPQTLDQLPAFYADDAYFKDPFNEVSTVTAITKIFRHMYQQIEDPRFKVLEQLATPQGAMLVWELSFGKARKAGPRQSIRGVSHLRFQADGKVSYHRDYWDTAEELYMKLPLLGLVPRLLRRMLKA